MERHWYVGQAGWSLRKEFAAEFPGAGTHLERYAARLTGVEINSSFYRPHQPKTYARWSASVPPGFRFAIKAPQAITHHQRLVDVDAELAAFLFETSALGEKRGPLLFQLPPSLAFDARVAGRFLQRLRGVHAGPVVWEPRHRSWFQPEADSLLASFGIARVAADPAVVPAAAQPGGDGSLAYYRWHGSPRMYHSAYGAPALAALAAAVRARSPASDVWCIFDNTTVGAATDNALALLRALDSQPSA